MITKKYLLHWGQAGLMGIIVLSIGLFFRFYPLHHFTTNDSADKATIYILAKLRQQITAQVNASHATAPQAQKEFLIKKLVNKIIHEQRNQLRQSIDTVAENIPGTIKDSDAPPYPYLLASDSFYYYNLTENILQTGKLSDTVKGSKYLNKLMMAPKGHWEPFNLHPYVGAWLYKTLKIFWPSIELMFALSFTPLLITTCALIAFLMLCRNLKGHALTHLVGASAFLLAPIFIKRSTFGWYDNDPYNCLFPLVILIFFFKGLDNLFKNKRPTFKTLLAPALGCATALLLYAYFWQGWMLMFAIIGCAGITLLALNAFLTLKNKEQNYPPTALLIQYGGTILMASFIFISMAFGFEDFFILFKEGWVALKNFLTPQLSPWPDLYISVGELHKASFSKIIELTGGPFYFIVALWGLISTPLQSFRQHQYAHLYKSLTLMIFFTASFLLTLGAQRFAMLFLIPLSLTFVLGLQSILNLTTTFSQNWPRRQRQIGQLSICTLMLLYLIIPVRHMHQSIRTLLNPIYNTTWDKALTAIRTGTPKNSVINTWWPPGHFIKAMAKRAVTFDGASINVPQAYWMANVFLSTTEEEALGLLRMLNGSGNAAATFLQEIGMDLPNIILLLKEITKVDRGAAARLLVRVLPSPQNRQHLLELTHTPPPPGYLMLYNEFVASNLQLKFIGHWNFKQIDTINKNPSLIAQVPPANSKEYIDFLWQLSGKPYKYSGPLDLLHKKGPLLLFTDNVTIDTNTMTCTIQSPKYGQGIPQSLFYLKDNQVIEKVFPNANLPFSVLLVKRHQKEKAVLLDRPLAQSLMTRLYFFEGKGLKYFHPFDYSSDLTKRTEIYTYTIDWKNFLTQP